MATVVVFLVPLFREQAYIKKQCDGRKGRLEDGARRLREEGHHGPVVTASSFAALPRKHGHGNGVMRAWLAHAASRWSLTPAMWGSGRRTSTVTGFSSPIPPITGWSFGFPRQVGGTLDADPNPPRRSALHGCAVRQPRGRRPRTTLPGVDER